MIQAVRAVLFDMDGTLVDTEGETDAAIAAAGLRRGLAEVALPPDATRGRTWFDIAAALIARPDWPRTQDEPRAETSALASELLELWRPLTSQAPALPGAPEAVRAAAAAGLGVAVVSSSPRAIIAAFMTRLGLSSVVPPEAQIGAESVGRSKPDPEGFLKAAEVLGVDPGACVVFEDSAAGLAAARAAGMSRVAVLACASHPERIAAAAQAAISDYRDLPKDFFEALARDGVAAFALIPKA